MRQSQKIVDTSKDRSGKMGDQVSDELLKELKQAISLLQALKISGVNLRRDAEGLARANCPFPAHLLRSPSFVVKLTEPEHFSCEVCGVTGDVRTYIAAFCAPPPDRLSINSVIATAVEAQTSLRRLARAPSEWRAHSGIAADEQAIQVYETLLYELELFGHHRAYLERRGLSADICYWNEYRSLPASQEKRLEMCEKLMASRYCLEGVPGFFRISEAAPNPSLRGKWCLGGDDCGRRVFRGKVNDQDIRYEVGGILIPVRDRNLQITRFEILNDLPDPDAPEGLKAQWPPRLSLLTSPGEGGGELPGTARLHRVGPEDGGEMYGGAVWVTDSALRADILSAVFEARAFGVTNFDQLWREIIEAISSYQRVIIAVGGEKILPLARLSREAAREGIEALIASWEQREAFDDSGLSLPDYCWNPRPYEQWWSGQPPEIRERVEFQLRALP
jgi:hypothetical protein